MHSLSDLRAHTLSDLRAHTLSAIKAERFYFTEMLKVQLLGQTLVVLKHSETSFHALCPT